jgi:uncharacterized protein YndB with AHSA1/START domain
MAVMQLGDQTTTVYADGEEFVMDRVFDAPRDLVWRALTEPERIPRWWGSSQDVVTVVEMDVRPGGRWRWVTRTPDGDAPFCGVYLEVAPPERLVHTEMFDVEPFNLGEPAIVSLTLEDVGGRTRLVSRSRFPSEAALQGALATGMVGGAIESWNRLETEAQSIR